MIDTENLGELPDETEDATPKPESAARENRLKNLADRWRRKAVRFGSKDEGVLNDPAQEQAIERPTGDPWGPTAPAAAIQGYNSGGRRGFFDPHEQKFDNTTGFRQDQKAEALPFHEPDDEDVIWRYFFRPR